MIKLRRLITDGSLGPQPLLYPIVNAGELKAEPSLTNNIKFIGKMCKSLRKISLSVLEMFSFY